MNKENSSALRKMLICNRVNLMSLMKSDHLSQSECLGHARREERIDRKTTSLWEPAGKLGEARLAGSVHITREKSVVDNPLMEVNENLMEKEKLRIKLEKFKESDIKLDLSRVSQDKSESSTPLSTKRTLRQTKKKTSTFKPIENLKKCDFE